MRDLHQFLMSVVFSVLTMLLCTVSYAAEVTDVRWGVDRYDVLRFVVDCDAPPKYSVNIVDKEMIITVESSLAENVTRSHKLRSNAAKVMTVDEVDKKTVLKVRLEKSLDAKEYKAFTLKKDPVTKRPDRLVVDILSEKRTTPLPPITPVKAEIKDGKQGDGSDKDKKSDGGGRKVTIPIKPHKIDKPDTKLTEKKEEKKDKGKHKFRIGKGIEGKRITLDAGHGGSDPGAIGPNGTMEKDITLKIAKKVQERLEKKDAIVTMTRTKDTNVCAPMAPDAEELQARVDIAEKNKADVFISIHINAAANKKAGGFSSYYHPKTEYDAKIAQAIQNKMTSRFKLDDLGIRKANFYVNKRCSMPSTLLELGFISNAKEEKLMHSRWYINKLADAIADGIEDYFE